jgi:hypothetical protein
MKKRAKDVQQELALDMKLLEQMLTATTNEAMQSLQKKVTRSTLVIQIVIGSQRYSIEFVMCILAFFKQNEEQKKYYCMKAISLSRGAFIHSYLVIQIWHEF